MSTLPIEQGTPGAPQSQDGLQQILDLIKQSQGGRDKLNELAAQQVQNQPMRKEGQSVGSMLTGRGASGDQQRAMSQVWSSILNRDRGKQTAIGAAGEGMEKGRQLMDSIRKKDKDERLAAQMTELEGQDRNIDLQTSAYEMQRTAEQEEYDRSRDVADDTYRDKKLLSDELTRDQNISVNTEKQYKEFWDAKNKSSARAAEYESLAKQFAEADYTGGLPTRIKELTKELIGDEDKQTALIKAGQGVAVSSAILNLPPGVASDRDIELVMRPQPGQFANPEYMREYLKARAKIEKLSSEYNQFALTYMDQNSTKGNKMIGLDTAWRLHKIPYGAKQMLRDDPNTKAKFDIKYGKGMADKVLK